MRASASQYGRKTGLISYEMTSDRFSGFDIVVIDVRDVDGCYQYQYLRLHYDTE